MNICIFEKNKKCDKCGKCDICDLNSNKICDNCGKCLELEGVDIKAINIEDIAKKVEENEIILEDSLGLEVNLEQGLKASEEIDIEKIKGEFNIEEEEEFEDAWEHLEYIDDIQDIILDKEAIEKYSTEEFPGLIRLNIEVLEREME